MDFDRVRVCVSIRYTVTTAEAGKSPAAISMHLVRRRSARTHDASFHNRRYRALWGCVQRAGLSGGLATAVIGVLKVTAGDSQDEWAPYVVALGVWLAWQLWQARLR